MTEPGNRIWLAIPLLVVATVSHAADPLEPTEKRLKAHVAELASADYAGRRGEGARKAADYVAFHFKALKLEPLFDGRFDQPIPDKRPGEIQGRNVGAFLRGSDPRLRDEWVIVGTHFDHLGIRRGMLFPGADDNASGVAMMLETARAIANAPQRPKRSVMFIGFDLEEIGLFGSRYFAEHSPVPLDRVALFVTADMIGGSLAGVCHGHVFVLGSEHAPEVRPWIDDSARGQRVKVGLLGSDLLLLNRSDYGPFRTRRIPYLFFTTGESENYHKPSDTPESLDYAKVEAISRLIHGVVRRAAFAEARPQWKAIADNPLNEAITIREVMRCLLANREKLEIGAFQVSLMTNTVRTLDGIVSRGAITPEERTAVVRVAQIVLATVL
jgi:hypothetical protein